VKFSFATSMSHVPLLTSKFRKLTVEVSCAVRLRTFSNVKA